MSLCWRSLGKLLSMTTWHKCLQRKEEKRVTMELLTEMIIESKMEELPKNKRKIIREEEMRKRRLELKEAKENVKVERKR